MGNSCHLLPCEKENISPHSDQPMELFYSIVTIQRLVRGFLARRQRSLLKKNISLIDKERQLLIKYGFPKLESFITPSLLQNEVTIKEYSKHFIIGNSTHQRFVAENMYKEGILLDNMDIKKGTLYQNGILCRGNFQNNLLQGRGYQQLPDGSTYEGTFENGLRCGFGKLVDSVGNVYEGLFKENLINGEGEFFWQNGNYYKGQVKNNLMHGYGEKLFSDGTKYIGQFQFGRKHGDGEYISKHGRCVIKWICDQEIIYVDGRVIIQHNRNNRSQIKIFSD